ncbi:MAG TPA: hypothetical protein VGK58_12525 [Lacipirellulaceae bacterium]
MKSRRRLKVLSPDQLHHHTEERLLAYRKKASSLANCPEDADYSPARAQSLDADYIWFKSDPRWKPAYGQILDALARVQ